MTTIFQNRMLWLVLGLIALMLIWNVTTLYFT